MKKIILLILTVCIPMVASADAVEINGLYYNLISKSKTAEVTRNPSIDNMSGCYSGDIAIPPKVTYENVEYDVKTIGNSAFSYCNELTSIDIPNTIISIGNAAFYCCEVLTSVNIPNSVTSIGEGAFQGCWAMTSLTLSSNITAIEDRTFEWCIGLLSISIPDGVSSLGDNAFYGCVAMKSVDLPNSITSFGTNCFYDCMSLTSISLPNNLTYIEAESFKSCSGLTTINIPNSVIDIYDAAFQNCSSLSVVTIGTGLNNIGTNCFANCSELTDVYCFAGNVPTTAQNAFKSSQVNNAQLHVPSASINSYSSSAPWSGFGAIDAIVSEDITIGDLGIATFCGNNPIDFSNTDGIKAYVVSSFEPSTSIVTLTRVNYVPPFTGVIVKGSKGVHTIPAGIGQPLYPNLLKGVTSNTMLNKVDGDYTNFVLAYKGGNLGFYAVTDGSTLGAGKAYLPLPTADLPSAARELVLNFDDGETTSIQDVVTRKESPATYYDLQGRRVAQPKSGLYIVNGKKVIIK